MTALILGLDVSPLRLGWALVRLDDGSPVACGCEAMNLPPDYHHDAANDALFQVWCASEDAGGKWPNRGEVSLVYIEQPAFAGGLKATYRAGRAVGVVQGEVERRWPHAPVEFLQPDEWKAAAKVPTEHKKLSRPAVVALVKPFAVPKYADLKPGPFLRAVDLGFNPDGQQDAADAACIAYAGWRINVGEYVTAGGSVR